MPKKKSGRRKAVTSRGDEMEVDALETDSVISLLSEGSDTPQSSLPDVEDECLVQNALDKVCCAVDLLCEKRAETRAKALRCIIDVFRLHYACLDGSWNYAATLLSGIEHVLKKGKGQDQVLAAECLSIFVLQYDESELPELVFQFSPLLSFIVRDATAYSSLRGAAATALSILHFLVGYTDNVSVLVTMKSLKSVFHGSCLKGDGKAPVIDPALSRLHIASLCGWTLLFTILPTFEVDAVAKDIVPTLVSLLQAVDVNMRILSGESLAVVYERVRGEIDSNFKGPFYGDIIRLINKLATDGTKNKSKGDRKKQRHSFRDLIDSIARYEAPETSIKVAREDILLSSCVQHFHYDTLRTVLGGGMNRHLQYNYTVRGMFELGAPTVTELTEADRRAMRDQKRCANSFAFKMRTQMMSSRRDRRSNVVHESD